MRIPKFWLDCHNKISQIGCLKQQKFISSQLWRLAVQDQDVGRFGSSLACGWSSPHCVLTWPVLHAHPSLVSLPLHACLFVFVVRTCNMTSTLKVLSAKHIIVSARHNAVYTDLQNSFILHNWNVYPLSNYPFPPLPNPWKPPFYSVYEFDYCRYLI